MRIRGLFSTFLRPAEEEDSERVFRDFEAMGAPGESQERRAGHERGRDRVRERERERERERSGELYC